MSQYLYYCVVFLDVDARNSYLTDKWTELFRKKRDLVEFKAISGDNYQNIRIRAFTKRGSGSATLLLSLARIPEGDRRQERRLQL